MKRYALYLLLALSLLVNVGVVAGAWLESWRTESAVERSWFGMRHQQVPAYLHLDAGQRAGWEAMERQFVSTLNASGRAIQGHRERLVREILSSQPDASVIERERAAIFALQEAQQRSVIVQLAKEREMLSPAQRNALADLLLAQGSGTNAALVR